MIEKLHSEMKKNVVLCPKCGSYIPQHQPPDAIRRKVVRCIVCGHESKLEGEKVGEKK
jgi:DNA-directed RNA polymerase subunit RPC12/RpoP